MSFDERKEWKSNGILSLIRSGFTLCFLIMSMWICVCEYRFPQRLQQGPRFPHDCELSNMSFRNQAHALQKSSKYFSTTKPSLQPIGIYFFFAHCALLKQEHQKSIHYIQRAGNTVIAPHQIPQTLIIFILHPSPEPGRSRKPCIQAIQLPTFILCSSCLLWGLCYSVARWLDEQL